MSLVLNCLVCDFRNLGEDTATVRCRFFSFRGHAVGCEKAEIEMEMDET